MKQAPWTHIEKYRVRGERGQDFGAFLITGPNNMDLRIIASSGMGWEHVSVSLTGRTPNWKEMCFVKNLFWEEDELVVQYHPTKENYINHHPNCLHMWKPKEGIILTPPRWMIGPYDGWEEDARKAGAIV